MTDREMSNLIESVSRIIRNVKLIKQGKTTTKDGEERLEIIDKVAKELNQRICGIETKQGQ